MVIGLLIKENVKRILVWRYIGYWGNNNSIVISNRVGEVYKVKYVIDIC